MEDNNNITTVDLEMINQIISNQQQIIEGQTKIIEGQDKIIDHFIPSNEELKEQEKQNKLKAEEEKKLQEEEQKILEEKELAEEEYKEELINKIGSMQEHLESLSVSSSDNLEVSKLTTSSVYITLFTIVFTIIIYYIYRLIRTWFI